MLFMTQNRKIQKLRTAACKTAQTMQIHRRLLLKTCSRWRCWHGFSDQRRLWRHALQFSLDRAIDGAAAPFVVASARGLFRAENLNVTTGQANGSVDAITRVASGTSDMALADINALIRYRDKEGSVPVKAVFVLYNKAPYAIIARKSRGIATMGDIEGEKIGIVDGDLAARLWPAVARKNDIKLGKIKAKRSARRCASRCSPPGSSMP
jgi:NitT/TauT family transport system substrate-binding protein